MIVLMQIYLNIKHYAKIFVGFYHHAFVDNLYGCGLK